MPPVETANLRTSPFMVRPDQIVQVDEVKARLQKVTPGRSISRSEVVRECLDRGLPLIEAELDQTEAIEDEGAAQMMNGARGP